MAATGVRRARYDSLLAVWRLKDTRARARAAAGGAEAGEGGRDRRRVLHADHEVLPRATGAGCGAAAAARRRSIRATAGHDEDATGHDEDGTGHDEESAGHDEASAGHHQARARHDQARRSTIPAQAASSTVVILNNKYMTVPEDKIPDDAYYPSGLPAGKRAIAAAARQAAPAGVREPHWRVRRPRPVNRHRSTRRRRTPPSPTRQLRRNAAPRQAHLRGRATPDIARRPS